MYMLISVGHLFVSTPVCLSDVHISAVYQVLLGLLPPRVLAIILVEVFLSSAIGHLYSRCCFLCSVFLMMSPVAATTTTTAAVMCSRESPITTTVTMVSNFVGLAAFGQLDVILPPQFILRDTVRSSIGLTTVLQWQQPQFQMPSQAYTIYAMGPTEVSFLFRVVPSINSLCYMLVPSIVFTFVIKFPCGCHAHQ